MSSDALKKRKSKVLRSEGGTPEMKRGRGEGDQQVTLTSGRHREGPVDGNGGAAVCCCSVLGDFQTDLITLSTLAN